jgi:hypothetical protein
VGTSRVLVIGRVGGLVGTRTVGAPGGFADRGFVVISVLFTAVVGGGFGVLGMLLAAVADRGLSVVVLLTLVAVRTVPAAGAIADLRDAIVGYYGVKVILSLLVNVEIVNKVIIVILLVLGLVAFEEIADNRGSLEGNLGRDLGCFRFRGWRGRRRVTFFATTMLAMRRLCL